MFIATFTEFEGHQIALLICVWVLLVLILANLYASE